MERKWDYINELDEELLVGGVILSEWSTFLIRDVDTAFCAGAHLAAILTSQAAIESHLRFEYPYAQETPRASFYDLIEKAPISTELKAKLHRLRRYRNKWVHVNEPQQDDELLTKPEYYEAELEEMARFAVRVLREVIYLEQWL
jgi:hypothetical protein